MGSPREFAHTASVKPLEPAPLSRVLTIDTRTAEGRAQIAGIMDRLCAGSTPLPGPQPHYRTIAEGMAATDAAAARWKASADPDVALAQWRARTAGRGIV